MISSALLPSAQAASERRTPTNALARGSPNASRMRCADSKFTICSSTFWAKRRTPRRFALLRRPAARILADRVGQRQPVLDAAEPAGEHRGEPEVGVARGIGGLELDVRVLRADRLGAGHEAQRGLAVVDAPEGVRAREVAGAQADQRGHARSRHGDHARAGRAGCRRRTPRPRASCPRDRRRPTAGCGRPCGSRRGSASRCRRRRASRAARTTRAGRWRARPCGSSRARATGRRPR